MDKRRQTKISKFLSYILRHHPESITIKLDNGKTVVKQSLKYYTRLTDADDIKRTIPLFRDKTASQQRATQLQKEIELARAGVVDRYKEHRKRPLAEHLEDFHQALLAKVAQKIMRHSDINLTMSRYTHTLTGQEAKAVAELPDLSQPSKGKQRAIATGTDGKTIPENIPFLGGQQRISANSNKQQNCVSGIANAVFQRARQDSNLQPSDSKSATLSN